MKSVRLAVLGALGRLGKSILDAANNDSHFAVTAAVVHGASAADAYPDISFYRKLTDVRSGVDVVVDATRADSVAENLAWALSKKLPYLLAATGISKSVEKNIEDASRTIPIVIAPNLSVGIALLNDVVGRITKHFPSDIQIIETHHKAKKDSPSGTALSIAQTINDIKPKGDVFLHSIRGGDIVGQHHVLFLAQGERIEVNHVVTDRAIFARGALQAACFLVGRKPGMYTMRNVLDLKEKK